MEAFSPIFFITFPSFLAIAIKLWLLVNSNKRNLLVTHWPLMLVLLGTGVTNLLQFLTFSQLITPGVAALEIYYLGVILSIFGLLCLSIRNIKLSAQLTLYFSHILNGLTTVLVLLVLGTDLVIAGYQMIGSSITRLAGPYYWLFQVYAMFGLLLAIGLNVYGAFGESSSGHKCKATLLCFLPIVISGIAIILLMQAGANINASLILPLATTYLLLALIYIENKDKVFKILVRMPFTHERKGFKLLTAEIEHFLGEASNGDKVTLKKLTKAIERHVVALTVEMTNGNQARAASLLNTSTSSVCRKVNS
ncbi:MAG: hypothetical protein P8M72_08560 [Gammaproteobacteria bacterium]|nr:hypothetical protein [Gammaproteobacteria bacterium]